MSDCKKWYQKGIAMQKTNAKRDSTNQLPRVVTIQEVIAKSDCNRCLQKVIAMQKAMPFEKCNCI